MCKCKEKIDASLQTATGDPHAKLNMLYRFDPLENRFFVTYSYREQNEKGEYSETKTGKLALSQCPFCGEKTKIINPINK